MESSGKLLSEQNVEYRSLEEIVDAYIADESNVWLSRKRIYNWLESKKKNKLHLRSNSRGLNRICEKREDLEFWNNSPRTGSIYFIKGRFKE